MLNNLFILAGVPEAAADAPTSNLMLIGYVILLGAMFYFLLIRPQRKQRKEKNDMMSALAVGTEIYTIGGILGTVTRINDRTIWLRISEKTEIELLKSSIGGINKVSE